MKDFSPTASEVRELANRENQGIYHAKSKLTTLNVIREIQEIKTMVNSVPRIDRLCDVLEFMIQQGAIKF